MRCDLLEFKSGHFSSSMVPVLFWSHSQLNASTFPVHRFCFFLFIVASFRTDGRSVILLAANTHTTKNKTMRSHKLLIHCKTTNLLWISYLGKSWDGNNNKKINNNSKQFGKCWLKHSKSMFGRWFFRTVWEKIARMSILNSLELDMDFSVWM